MTGLSPLTPDPKDRSLNQELSPPVLQSRVEYALEFLVADDRSQRMSAAVFLRGVPEYVPPHNPNLITALYGSENEDAKLVSELIRTIGQMGERAQPLVPLLAYLLRDSLARPFGDPRCQLEPLFGTFRSLGSVAQAAYIPLLLGQPSPDTYRGASLSHIVEEWNALCNDLPHSIEAFDAVSWFRQSEPAERRELLEFSRPIDGDTVKDRDLYRVLATFVHPRGEHLYGAFTYLTLNAHRFSSEQAHVAAGALGFVLKDLEFKQDPPVYPHYLFELLSDMPNACSCLAPALLRFEEIKSVQQRIRRDSTALGMLPGAPLNEFSKELMSLLWSDDRQDAEHAVIAIGQVVRKVPLEVEAAFVENIFELIVADPPNRDWESIVGLAQQMRRSNLFIIDQAEHLIRTPQLSGRGVRVCCEIIGGLKGLPEELLSRTKELLSDCMRSTYEGIRGAAQRGLIRLEKDSTHRA